MLWPESLRLSWIACAPVLWPGRMNKNKKEKTMTIQEKDIAITALAGGSGDSAASDNDGTLYSHLLVECNAMVRYGLSNGLEVDPSVVGQLQKITEPGAGLTADELVKQLAAIHKGLSKTVYPATPRSIALLAKEHAKNPFLYFLGPVPLVRRLSAVAVFFLLALLTVSLDQDVNVDNINLGLLNSNNHILFSNQLFILCCAGLGASFAGLFKANGFIANATYDPRYDSSYWSRIILGLIAGVILVELLPSNLFAQGSMHSFGKPALAMLGGFSANVVYRILQRLVEALETVVKGGSDAKGVEQKALLNVKASEQRTQLNADTAGKLVGLLNEMDGTDGSEMKKKISGLIEELLPAGSQAK